MHPFRPNPSQPRIAVENIIGISLQVGLPVLGDPGESRCPTDLRAVTWPDGKRIDLTWTNPEGVQSIIIKRSQLAHSAFITDDKETIYSGPAIEHFIDGAKIATTLGGPVGQQTPPLLEISQQATGIPLEENTYYYYTLYMTTKSGATGIFDYGIEARSNCQVTGLSIIDYFESPERGKWYGDWLYKLFPEKTRELDEVNKVALGRQRGYFEDFCHFLQGGFNIIRGHALALEHLTNVDRLPAGLVGRSFDQSTILGAWARRFAIPPERFILDPEILRRITASMIFLYKEKGTCPGIVDFTKVLTQWDSVCIEFGDEDGAACDRIYLRTWDTEITETEFILQLSSVNISPGIVEIPGAGLTPDRHINSLIVDSVWNQHRIVENSSQIIELEDETAVMAFEDLITIVIVAPVLGTIYDLVVTRTFGGPPRLNDQEYDVFKILDSANQEMSVSLTQADFSPTESRLRVDSSSPPTVGDAAAALGFVLGADFASRDPAGSFRVFTGCPTFLYDPLMDITLLPDQVPGIGNPNPHDILFSGGTLKGIPFVPGDTLLTIQSGIAKFVGTSTSVLGNVLTDTSANFGPMGSNNFAFLNPNRNQTQTFRIISSTTTTITVEAAIPGITLESLAAPVSSYFVLEFKENRFYQILTRLIDLFVPVTSKIFIFFDE